VSWRWISITALLAAVVIGYNAFMRRSGEPAAPSEELPQPGYFLRQAVVTQTQKDGSLGLRLTAERIQQRPLNDAIVMDGVRANYFRAQDHEWIMTARHGVVPPDSRTVQLDGDVELRPADATPTAFLRVDSLAVDTEKNIAYSTSSPVEVRFGPHAVTVKRFVADLNSEKIHVESPHGRYEPQQ
jgi:LPS export ABC transporter protein LptC